ncbi:thioredoxin family protein [Geobacter hydrogenophilus]|uniref:Thiol reductase thioredoxin n=1 Tax=Geobacter hydrogenophilus TaxID=40983 RepID=A0A9W6G1C6_9BACT|nr:thioredoxin family protein [Geobacter hydrogenophilus]MBT0894159.1 thioredoxin family protein [Geobacter hydrogenophilus]GLI38558.1 thiol reductase thioredoxin [Geobacter hydrogenophilus]
MRVLAPLFLLLTATVARAELPSASDAAINQTLASGKPAIIDVGARYCIPCKRMAPILESLATEYRGKAGVLFIDVNENQAAPKRFRVQMIPTQIFFDGRGKEVKRHMGFMEKADIVKELKALGAR